MNTSEHKSIKKRNRGRNKRIGFSEETVTKEAAKTLLSKESIEESNGQTFFSQLVREESNVETESQPKQPKKRKQNVSASDANLMNEENITPKKKKDNQKKEMKAIEQDGPEECTNTNQSNNSLSKRAAKRLKHQEILENKKKESLKSIQQNALNYLSKWKYSRTEWKFEKLKQIWLTQNLFDSSKIDDKYWESVVEYFANSQGKVRQEILEKAIKIVEDEDIELNDSIKFKRARDIVQSLQ